MTASPDELDPPVQHLSAETQDTSLSVPIPAGRDCTVHFRPASVVAAITAAPELLLPATKQSDAVSHWTAFK
jgi:hypothetical protein